MVSPKRKIWDFKSENEDKISFFPYFEVKFLSHIRVSFGMSNDRLRDDSKKE
jgi:hypothetical protein